MRTENRRVLPYAFHQPERARQAARQALAMRPMLWANVALQNSPKGYCIFLGKEEQVLLDLTLKVSTII